MHIHVSPDAIAPRTSQIAPITKPTKPSQIAQTMQSQVVGIETIAFKHRCDVWTMDENSRIKWDGIARIARIVRWLV